MSDLLKLADQCGAFVEYESESDNMLRVTFAPGHWEAFAAALAAPPAGISPAPLAGSDAVDAARYRWLRERNAVLDDCGIFTAPAQADEAKGIDERDLAHEADMRALMRQQLRDNISPEEAEAELAERDALEQDGWDDAYPMGDPDEYDTCHHCNDDGMDPDCDYLLPCPVCQGEQPPPALHPGGSK